MAAFFNQYSFVIFSALGLVVVFIGLRVVRARVILAIAITLALAATLTLGYVLVLRPGDSDVASVQSADDMIANGQPTMIEFFSNYCAGCVAARPEVDALVNEIDAQLGGSFNVLRIDIHTDFGRILRERYEFSFSPEFLLFDGNGVIVSRTHTPPSLEQINALVQDNAREAADATS